MSCLIKKIAPDFSAKAVQEQRILEGFSLDRYRGQNVVLFFYPLDFTFVCPTELHAFQERQAEFKDRNAQLVACSIDSVYTHLAWLNTPKSKGGIEGITYPIISDINKTIARDFGILCEEEGVAFRGLFIIDADGIVRHQIVNDLPIGRSVDEALRTLDAILYIKRNGEVCPANWQPGHASLKTTKEAVENYFACVNR
jgi:peroxiredoxin (alkyl hydroperoxide reductase subunit C)